VTTIREAALDRWWDYDRDRPFALSARVRETGPVREVTLADGHRAFLVLGYAAAREALNHPDLSRDMLAAPRHAPCHGTRVGGSSPARRGVCQAGTRRRGALHELLVLLKPPSS
jgi:hypothetical protein